MIFAIGLALSVPALAGDRVEEVLDDLRAAHRLPVLATTVPVSCTLRLRPADAALAALPSHGGDRGLEILPALSKFWSRVPAAATARVVA